MLKVLPQQIIHLHLHDPKALSDITQTKVGKYYIVIWWRQIPLCDLYVDQIQKFHLLNAMMKRLENVLSFYSPNIILVLTALNGLKSSDLATFNAAMHEIFVIHFAVNLPNKLHISVVVCTRNRSGHLKKCLSSLLEQVCLPAEIIVVDNAPDGDETKTVTESFDQVIYLKEPRPGLDIARNSGARKAQYSIIAYTDDDVRVDPFWAYRIWQSFLDPDIDALTGLVIAASLETESQQIFEEHWGFNKGFKDIYFGPEFLKQYSPAVWVIGAGANMAFRKKVFETVGYFDERLDVGAAGCSGDSEIWYRILAAGSTIQYNPRAVVYHEHQKEIPALHRQLYNYTRGFAASSLIQHGHNPRAGYKSHLFIAMPKYYLLLLRAGFPTYKFRYRTLWSEIKGLASGILFYYKNKNTPSLTKTKSYG
jgi:glycosyltransferase involved in cell wall biosynthesis